MNFCASMIIHYRPRHDKSNSEDSSYIKARVYTPLIEEATEVKPEAITNHLGGPYRPWARAFLPSGPSQASATAHQPRDSSFSMILAIRSLHRRAQTEDPHLAAAHRLAVGRHTLHSGETPRNPPPEAAPQTQQASAAHQSKGTGSPPAADSAQALFPSAQQQQPSSYQRSSPPHCAVRRQT